ncbi:hypothetical protein DIPPA_60517 [Diplonema papillatum]|nr:hypothetical protein DIPPA_60517 [Diplonema papillatum]
MPPRTKWIRLASHSKKCQRRSTPRFLGTEHFGTDTETAAYIRRRYSGAVTEALGDCDALKGERLRMELEHELDRLRQANPAAVREQTLSTILDYVGQVKGGKRAHQMYEKWKRLGLHTTPACTRFLLPYLSGARLDKVWRECTASTSPVDVQLVHAWLRGRARGTKGVDDAVYALSLLQESCHAPTPETHALLLRLARFPSEATKILRLCSLTWEDVMQSAPMLESACWSVEKVQHAMHLLSRWCVVANQPLPHQLWDPVVEAGLKQNAKRQWRERLSWDAFTEMWGRIDSAGLGPSSFAYASCMKAAALRCSAMVAVASNEMHASGCLPQSTEDVRDAVRFAEKVFSSALQRGRYFNHLLWIWLFATYQTAGLPKRSLVLGRLSRAQWKVRPTKALLASYVRATRPLAAAASQAKGRFVPIKVSLLPKRCDPYKEHRPPPETWESVTSLAVLPWTPGQRPDRRLLVKLA